MDDHRRDVWDLLTLGLWSIFFAIGLVPELAFYAFREAAAVAPHTALVNSSAVITIAFTAYIAIFAGRSCRDAGLDLAASQGKAVEIAVLALIAFIEIPAKGSAFEARTLFEVLFEVQQLPGRYLQGVVLFVGLSKLLAWLYLYSLVLRYHAFGNHAIFARIPSLFPSSRDDKRAEDPAPKVEAFDESAAPLRTDEIAKRAAGTKQG